MIPLKDTVRSRTFPLVNWALIAINVVMFLYEINAGPAAAQRAVYNLGVIPRAFVENPNPFEYFTLLTSMFLHGGGLHLLSNMLALYIFGDNVEDAMGPLRYIAFYLICGGVAGLTHVFLNPYSELPSVGASGAIAGVLGAYIVLYPGARVLTLIPIFIIPWIVELPAFVYLGFWFITQLFSGTLAIVQTADTARPGAASG